MVKRTATVLKNIACCILVGAALIKLLAVAAAYVALSHRSELQYWLSVQLGVPVAIGDVRIHWNSYIPRLSLIDLSIGEDAALNLGDAQIGIHLPALVARRKVVPINLLLNGTRIHILRDASGATRILGLSPPEDGHTPMTPLALPAFLRIRNASLTWEDRKRDAHIDLSNIDLQLINLQHHYLLEASLETEAGQIRMRARASGDLLTSNWSASTYIDTQHFNVSELFAAYLPEGYQVENLVSSLQLWSHWTQGRHRQTRGYFRTDPFSLSNGGRSIPIDGFRGAINYTANERDWLLQLTDFSLTMWQQSWPDARLELAGRHGPDGNDELKLAASFLRLEDLLELSQLEPALAGHLAPLQGLDLEAELEDLQLHIPRNGGDEWRLSSRFSQLHSRAKDRIPGFDNIAGQLYASAKQMQLLLQSRDASIELPGLFRELLPLQRLEGQLDWFRLEDHWMLQSHGIIAENEDIHTLTRLRLWSNPLFIDLQTDFRNGRAENADRYYPVGIMKPALVDWLDQAIVSGRVSKGGALLYGPIRHFPFDKTHDGHFEVLFDTQDITLNYQPGWPPVTGVRARARFHNNRLDIDASRGQVLSSTASQAKVGIPQLHPPSKVGIQVQARGPLNDALRLLRETPLEERFGSRAAALQVDGKAQFRFQLDVPLRKKAPYAFEGSIDFEHNRLRLKDWDIHLEDILGKLEIGSDHFQPSELTAKTLGTTVKLSVMPGESGSTRISTRGNFPAAEILAMSDHVPDLAIGGGADFGIDIEIPSVAASPTSKTRLRISSDLQGIGIDTPAPLGKTPASTRALRIDAGLGEYPTKIQIHYENAFDLQVSLHPDRGVDVDGTLFELPLDHWLDFLKQRTLFAEADRNLPLRNLKLFVDRATLPPLVAENLEFTLNQNDNGWFGYLTSPTIAGSFTIPDDLANSPLNIQLQHLRIHYQPDTVTDETETPAEAPSYIDPRSFPGLQFQVEQLTFNEANLGTASLNAHPTRDGLVFDRIRLDGELAAVQGSGRWLYQEGEPDSSMEAKLTIPDLGVLLKQMRFTGNVEEAKTLLKLQANWPGGPAEFRLNRLGGQLDIEIAKGRLLDVDPGAGRFLGLLNLRALQRRLSLDFSDLYRHGLAIDSMRGSFLIENGNAYTNNFEIIGPTGRINISGRTGLTDRDYDQLASVTPRMGATLPIAGTVVGGPVAGLAVLLAQTLVTTAIPATKQLARVQYAIRGSWDEPVVERIRPDIPSDEETLYDE